MYPFRGFWLTEPIGWLIPPNTLTLACRLIASDTLALAGYTHLAFCTTREGRAERAGWPVPLHTLVAAMASNLIAMASTLVVMATIMLRWLAQ